MCGEFCKIVNDCEDQIIPLASSLSEMIGKIASQCIITTLQAATWAPAPTDNSVLVRGVPHSNLQQSH